MRIFNILFWILFLTVFPRFHGWIFSAWNDSEGYRLEDISFAEKDPADSHAIINDTVVREGDQVGKLQVQKIERGGVLVEDKLTGETKYIFHGQKARTYQIEIQDDLDPKYEEMIRSKINADVVDQVEIYRSSEKPKGPAWQEGVYGVTYDAAWTVADLIQYPRSGIQDEFAFGDAIRNYRESLRPGSPEAADLQTRLVALTRERIRNCELIAEAYGDQDSEALDQTKQSRLTGCANFLQGRT